MVLAHISVHDIRRATVFWFFPAFCIVFCIHELPKSASFFAVFLKYAGFSTFLRAFLFYRQGQSSRLTGQSHSRLWQSFETSCFQCSPISIARICNAWSKPGYKCGLSSKQETWEQPASTNARRYRLCPCAHLVHHFAFFFEAQTDSASGYTESVELSTHALAWRSIGHHLYTTPFWHCFHPT